MYIYIQMSLCYLYFTVLYYHEITLNPILLYSNNILHPILIFITVSCIVRYVR